MPTMTPSTIAIRVAAPTSWIVVVTAPLSSEVVAWSVFQFWPRSQLP